MIYGLFAAVLFVASTSAVCAQAQPIARVDHVPIAVKDLPRAGDDYRALGFSLKPGRMHDNSIDNLHAKHPNGTELELITASQPRDDLARKYLAFIAEGDGPAFLALQADFDELAKALDSAKIPFQRGWVMKAIDPSLDYLFFSGDNRSPSDKPEHFEHANGSRNLVAVWIADLENPRLVELLLALGASFVHDVKLLPDGTRGSIARLRDSEIRLLPRAKRLLAGRPIIGATLSTDDAIEMMQRLPRDKWLDGVDADYFSIVIGPAYTHGLWLEFRTPK